MSPFPKRSRLPVGFYVAIVALAAVASFGAWWLYSERSKSLQQKPAYREVSHTVSTLVKAVHNDRIGEEKRLEVSWITIQGYVDHVRPEHGLALVTMQHHRLNWVLVYLEESQAVGLRRGSVLWARCRFYEIRDNPITSTVLIYLHRCSKRPLHPHP